MRPVMPSKATKSSTKKQSPGSSKPQTNWFASPGLCAGKLGVALDRIACAAMLASYCVAGATKWRRGILARDPGETEPRGIGFKRGDHVGDDFVQRHAELFRAAHDLLSIDRPGEGFSPAASPKKRRNNPRATKSRGKLLRSSRSRAATLRRQMDGLRLRSVPNSDDAHNPCRATNRPLPKDRHLQPPR